MATNDPGSSFTGGLIITTPDYIHQESGWRITWPTNEFSLTTSGVVEQEEHDEQEETDMKERAAELLQQARDALNIDPLGRERRAVPSTDQEIREDDGTPHLVGHAAVFDKETVIGRFFREKIARGAFKKTIKEADVRHLFNHDPNYVLARTTNDTLLLKEDKVGLAFDAELNLNDPDAVRVAAKVERGDVTQSSFAFVVVKDQWEFPDEDDRAKGELPLRTIQEVKLYDTSSVTYPAYPEADTGLEMKSLDAVFDLFDVGDDVDERTQLIRGLMDGDLTPDMAPHLRAAIEALEGRVVECDAEGACSARAADEAPDIAEEPTVDEEESDDRQVDDLDEFAATHKARKLDEEAADIRRKLNL